MSWWVNPRIVLPVLVASLALNLFLGGLTAGRWIYGRGHGSLLASAPQGAVVQGTPAQGAAGERGMSAAFSDPARGGPLLRLAHRLPHPHDQTLREAVKAREAEFTERANALRLARRGVGEAFTADPFDSAAAERAFETLRQRQVALQALGQIVLVETARQLPKEARTRLIERGRPATEKEAKDPKTR